MFPSRGCLDFFRGGGIDGLKVFEMVQPPRHKTGPIPYKRISQGVGGVVAELVEATIQARG